MLLGVLLSFLTNGYIVYTYYFDEKLQKATITRLLMWASLVEVMFCIAMLLQEASFRIPDTPCIDKAAGCLELSGWHSWPSWHNIAERSVSS